MRESAYALLAVLFQLGLLTGPLLVSGLVGLIGPRAAVVMAATLASGSGLLLAHSPAARHRGTGVIPAQAARGGGGPWSYPGVRTLLLGCLGAGLASGLVGIGVPEVALAQGVPARSGVLLSLCSIGTLLGGIGWGAWNRRATVRHLPSAQAAATAAVVLVAASTGCLPAFATALLVTGVCTAPVAVTNSALLDAVTDRCVLAQAYAGTVCATLLGSAAGYALGGALAPSGPGWVFGSAATALACTVAWTLGRRRSLLPL